MAPHLLTMYSSDICLEHAFTVHGSHETFQMSLEPFKSVPSESICQDQEPFFLSPVL